MTEKYLQVIFGKLLKNNPPDKTAVYELKICKGNSMPFNQVKQHQIEALLQAKECNLYHKIADNPIFAGHKTRFTFPKPFDCLNIYKAEAYIVICYYKPRKKKEFILIDIEDFIMADFNSDRKSLTEEQAKKIATKITK